MKIIKYARISEINIGDVFISNSINYMHQKFFGNEIVNEDLLFESFDLDKRITGAEGNKLFYKVKKRNKIESFIILLLKIILFEILHKRKIKNQVKKSDVVFIGGGNLISEVNGSDLFYRILRIAKIAKANNKKLVIYAVGIGPFEFSYNFRLQQLINLSDTFCVRDAKSFDYCNNSKFKLNKKVKIVLDPAFIVSDIMPKMNIEKKYIGINFMNFERIVKDSSYNKDELIENLISINANYKLPFKIINSSFGEDLSLSIEYKEKLESLGIPCIIFNIKSMDDLPLAYSDLFFFIASRMHSSIFSMSYNIPTLIFSWHPKIEYLEDHLFGKYKCKIILDSENFDSKEVIDKIDNYHKSISLESVIDTEKEKIYKDYVEIISGVL